MAYDQTLAERIRSALRGKKRIKEKAMFGGYGFLLRGNVCVGIWKDALIARVGAEAYPDCLAQPHVRPFDITGRAMTGWILVDPPGVLTDEDLQRWVELCLEFVQTLLAK